MPKTPDPEPTPEELNADLAAKHAEEAAMAAAEAERDLAEATKDDPGARLCPHCNAQMVKHGPGNPAKAGAWHCSDCGCCFRGNKLREGHPGCDKA